MITPLLANEITQSGKEVITLKHAFRVNGLVDIYFYGNTLFELKKKVYHKFKTPEEQIKKAFEIVENQEKAAPFKKTAKGRITYKEFNNRKRDAQPSAEYYAWRNNKSIVEDHLYFIQMGINVKIGRSINPEKRMSELKTGSPHELKILLIVKNHGHLEKKIHIAFKVWRKEGEWFHLSTQIKNFIEYLKEDGKLEGKRSYICES